MLKRTLTFLGLTVLMGCRPASTPVAMPAVTRPEHPHQSGTASWYGPGFEGKLMASKVPFDPEAMVAAHRTLPLGSFIRVTNLRNGLSALLRVMDRGPYIKGRILDVSLAAARDLGFDEDGLTDVEITLLPHGI